MTAMHPARSGLALLLLSRGRQLRGRPVTGGQFREIHGQTRDGIGDGPWSYDSFATS
jgi:hypothetical protein